MIFLLNHPNHPIPRPRPIPLPRPCLLHPRSAVTRGRSRVRWLDCWMDCCLGPASARQPGARQPGARRSDCWMDCCLGPASARQPAAMQLVGFPLQHSRTHMEEHTHAHARNELVLFVAELSPYMHKHTCIHAHTCVCSQLCQRCVRQLCDNSHTCPSDLSCLILWYFESHRCLLHPRLSLPKQSPPPIPRPRLCLLRLRLVVALVLTRALFQAKDGFFSSHFKNPCFNPCFNPSPSNGEVLWFNTRTRARKHTQPSSRLS